MGLQNFLQQVARRLNLDTSVKALTIAALVFSGITLASGVVYLIKGYAIPWYVFICSIIIGLGAAGVLIIKKWSNKKHAAYFADKHFNLKNGITTTLHLADSKNTTLHSLQEKWTTQKITQCKPSQIPFSYSKRLAAIALLLTAGASSIAFIPTSQTILNIQAEEALTLDRSQEAIDELKKVVEHMDKDLSDEERKEIDLNAIKKEVNKLEATGNRKEAVRQFARLEQKTRKMSKELEQKRDEEALKKSIKNLKKSPKQEAKKLAKQLEEKDFKEAVKSLKKLTPKKPSTKSDKKEQLKEIKAQVEKLRAISNQLAAASEASAASLSNSGASGGGGLGDAMQALDAQAKKIENMAKKIELEIQRNPNANLEKLNNPVSYTHLTLPTIYSV